jgi:outer membrane receptor protein involved in Fe transport
MWYAVPALSQQTGRVEGEIFDASTNRPVGTVQILIGGTRLGAITGANGRFVIPNVPVGAYELQARLIGYRVQTRQVTVQAGGVAEVEFRLSRAPVELDEVVVTGTAGMGTRRDVGNSVASVELRDLEAAPVPDVSHVLNATTAGLQQFRNEGQVGGGSRILLRGIKSVTQSPEPLIYIDGVRMNNNQGIYGNRQGRNIGPDGAQTQLNPVDDINPDDIERVEIVRGAAATTLYGTEAAGGVIQIFTKRGRTGQAPSWTMRVTGGTNFMTGNNFGNVLGKTPDWGFLKPHMKKGPLAEFDASVAGGTAGLAYFFSGSFDTEEGVVNKNDARRLGVRGNFAFEPTSRLKVEMNSGYTRRDVSFVESGDNASGLVLNVLRGTQDYVSTVGGDSVIYDIDNLAQTDHFVGGVTLTHTPWTSFVNRLTIGYDYQVALNIQDIPFNWPNYKQGSRDLNRWNHRTLTVDYAGSWAIDPTRSLSSRFSFGGQVFADWDHLLFGYGENFGGPGLKTVSSGALRRSDEEFLKVINAGFFLQEVVGVSERLFLTGGLRVDGNSAFGEDLGLQAYPKVSASYVLSDHDFWPEWWQIMKLRAAYGESGKAPGAFDAVRTWTPASAYEGQPGVTPANLGNPELGPERSKEIELGFEASMLDDRVGLDVTWFRSRTTDALFGVTEPPSQGFLRAQLRNVGTMENKGFEASLTGTPVAADVLRWDVTGTVSTVNGEVLDLGGAPPFYLGWGAALSQWVREGYPVVALFGQKVRNPDEIADPIIDPDQYYGPVYPTKTFGISTTVNVARRFTFNARGDYAGGHYQLNIMPWQQMRRGLWPECTDNYDANPSQALAIWRARCQRPPRLFDLWIRPADFFKLRTVSLAIELPRKWIPSASGASLTILGQNLWKWSKSPGLDPELTSGHSTFGPFPARYEYYQLPPASRVSFTLRATF